MNLSEISERLSYTLTKELDYDDDKKEIVAYGIESVFLTILGFLAIMIVAFLFDALVPAAIAAIFGGLLRKVSGGAHFNTPVKCLVFGAVVYSFLGVIAEKIIEYDLYNANIFLMLLVLSLVVVAFLSPVDCEAKPIHSLSFRKKLKFASMGFVAITLLVVVFSDNRLINTSAVLGIVYQTLTLLPVFNKKKGGS